MTNEQNVAVEAETVEVPKRRRTQVLKTTTAAEIIKEVETLNKAVEDLENAIETIDPSNIIFQLAEKELNGKRKELQDAYDTVYKF